VVQVLAEGLARRVPAVMVLPLVQAEVVELAVVVVQVVAVVV
jgi:hypothetical protein